MTDSEIAAFKAGLEAAALFLSEQAVDARGDGPCGDDPTDSIFDAVASAAEEWAKSVRGLPCSR